MSHSAEGERSMGQNGDGETRRVGDSCARAGTIARNARVLRGGRKSTLPTKTGRRGGVPVSSHPQLPEAISKPGEGARDQPGTLPSKRPAAEGRILDILFIPSQDAAKQDCVLRAVHGFITHRAGGALMSVPAHCVRVLTDAMG